MIAKSIRELKFQHVKLEQIRVRLVARDKILFEACVKAAKNKNRERAIICANELAEIRKLIKFLTHTQIAIERVILRLETIKELSAVIIDMKPALKALKGVASRLMNFMPEIAAELGKVSESIQETLSVSRIESPPPPLALTMKTPGAEQILNEVSSFLEEKITEQLPEPPISVITPENKQREGVKEMVALAASCSQGIYGQKDSHGLISYKNMELQELSLTIQNAPSVEDMVLDYVKKCHGKLDLKECASELNIPFQKLEKALENLGAQGKIQIRSR